MNVNILTVDPVVYPDLHFSLGNSSHRAHDIQEFENKQFLQVPLKETEKQKTGRQ